MDYVSLKQMIDTISTLGNYHVCIHDVSGILKKTCFKIPYWYAIHSKNFCSLAKSTQKGFDTCMNCKNCANHRAIHTGKAFAGLCAFGLFEAAKPVVIDGKTVCIIYLGNIVIDREKTLEKLRATCAKTLSPVTEMERELANSQEQTDIQTVMALCDMIDSYIRLLYEQYKDADIRDDSPYHWAVYNLKKYADENYSQTFTLESVCRLYFVNEKYAGKLFKEQIGMSFHEYLNKIRLQKAAGDLRNGKDRIIDIALRCGFNNITYFNRRFLEAYGMSPGQFRRLRS